MCVENVGVFSAIPSIKCRVPSFLASLYSPLCANVTWALVAMATIGSDSLIAGKGVAQVLPGLNPSVFYLHLIFLVTDGVF